MNISRNVLCKKVFTEWQYWIAFGFGAGLLPLVPGTWGTLPGVILYFFLSSASIWVYYAVVVVFFILGIYIADKVTRDLGVHDYSGIVWDEVVGYLITMTAIPKEIGLMLLGFIIFRCIDIWKPGPIRWIDRQVKGGLGIMLDDVAAGVLSCIVLHAIRYVL